MKGKEERKNINGKPYFMYKIKRKEYLNELFCLNYFKVDERNEIFLNYGDIHWGQAKQDT